MAVSVTRWLDFIFNLKPFMYDKENLPNSDKIPI